MIEIKNRFTGAAICRSETATTKGQAVREYIAECRTKGTRADLTGADLTGADLTGAVLTDADLTGADLTGADLTGAPSLITRKANALKRAERYRLRHPTVPVIAQLDAKILAAIGDGDGLDMSDWRSCDTTHCRGGWAITFAGEAGKKLEREYGSPRAATMIYRASVGRVPDFYARDEAALRDIREWATEPTA